MITDIPLLVPPVDEFGFGRTSEHLSFSGKLAMPEDLVDAILFLASDQSRCVNGEELKYDGGWTCFLFQALRRYCRLIFCRRRSNASAYPRIMLFRVRRRQ